MRLWLQSMDIETDDLATLFVLLDKDGSGEVSRDELCRGIPRLRGAARSIDVLALSERIKSITYPGREVHYIHQSNSEKAGALIGQGNFLEGSLTQGNFR